MQINRKKLVLFSSVVLCIFMIIYIKNCKQGTVLWAMLTKHETIELYNINSVEKYSNYHEENFHSQIPWYHPTALMESPGFEADYLFGDDCNFIVFGEVLQCDNYAFVDNLNGTDINFACHTVKLRVENDIYGKLEKGQEVYIFCRWHYDNPDENIEGRNSIAEGKKGIFIINGLPIVLHSDEKDICAIGSMRRLKRFHYCLTSYNEEVQMLKTKKDVVDFWKKKGWVY